MTADDHDLLLQSLFVEEQPVLDGEVFTACLVAKIRKLRYRPVAGLAGVALVMAVVVWLFAIPTREVAQFIAQGLTLTILDLGEGWLSWVLSPVNNLAGLLVLSVKAIRVARKKIIGAS